MSKPVHLPSYRLHKARNCAVVTIDGKNRYLGRYGSTESKEKYAKLVAEMVARDGSPAPTEPNDLRILELGHAYWEFAKGYYGNGDTTSGHLSRIKRGLHVLRELYGSTKAIEFGPLKFQAIQRRLVERGHVRTEINATCLALRRVFKWAVAQEMIPPAVYQGLQAVQGLRRGHTEAPEPDPVVPVDLATIEATLACLPPLVADMVRFQRLTGCRPGEVCMVRPGDIDISGAVWIYSPPLHKTANRGKSRRIHIGPRAQAVLRRYLLRPDDAYCFNPHDSERARHAILRSERKTKVQPSQRNRRKGCAARAPGDRYSTHAYARSIRQACAVRAGLVRPKRPADPAKLEAYRAALAEHNAELAKLLWSPNQLRHTAATEIRQQFGLEAAQVVLGHAQLNTTEIYALKHSALAASVMSAIG